MKDFKQLISTIRDVHIHLQSSAARAVNRALTIRNWLIGFYIVEFEQHGKDRAKYGDKLIESIASELKQVKGIDKRSLFRFRLFYLLYPQISETIRNPVDPVWQNDNKLGTLSPLLPDQEKLGSVSPQLNFKLLIPGDKIVEQLSYSHIEQLLGIDDQLKRTFYEIECIKGAWSIRELKRQISSQFFERSGLSENPDKLAEIVKNQTKPKASKDIIKNVYAFEFLDLNIKDVVEETDLERALLDHLQQFILELGHGFCFEARQKRILIGENQYFIDLLFYHRILKCHVLLELKIGKFEHGDIGQLNTYLNFLKDKIREKSDNSPVGILLVAEKDHALVKYATANMDENLFVQQYLLQLPSTEKLKAYIEKELKVLR